MKEEAAGSPLASPEGVKRQLQFEDDINQKVISLGDGKSVALIGLLATVISLVGVVVALIVGRVPFTVTPLAVTVGVAACVCFVGALLSLVVVMWPRMRGLPRDQSMGDFKKRIHHEAFSQGVSEARYRQTFRTQQVMWRKNLGVRYALVFTVLLVLLLIVFFTLLIVR